MSNVKISFSKKIATIPEMKLTLEQMGILEEALQHVAETTPDNQIGPIENLADMFGFDFSEIFDMEPLKNSLVDTGSLADSIDLITTYKGINGNEEN